MAYEQMSELAEKLKWAKHHITNTEIAIAKFVNGQPYSLRVDVETDPANPSVEVLKADPVTPTIRLSSGDAIQNLRSALDYLVCALVRANGTPTAQIEFPILRGPILTSDDEANFARKVAGLRQEAINQIRAIHPYKGGDDTLWRLHQLNRIHKHNMLVATLGNITAIDGLPPPLPRMERQSMGWVSPVSPAP